MTYVRALVASIGMVCLVLFLPAVQIILANDSFQVVGGWKWLTSLILVVFFFVVPVALLSCVLFALSIASGRMATGVHAAIFGTTLAIIWSQFYFYYGSRWLGEFVVSSGARALCFIAVAVALIAAGMRLARLIRTFMAYLAVLAPVTFWLVLALPTGLDIADAADQQRVEGAGRTSGPIFLVVLDGLSLVPLLDLTGEIDDTYFPTFARMSREWTWFSDATTNATATVLAQPMMFTGRLIEARASDNYSASRAQSLLTVLRRSHQMHVFTFGQGLCYAGADLCAESASPIGDVSMAVGLNKAVFAAWWEATVPGMIRDIYPPITNLDSWRFDWNGPIQGDRDHRDTAYAGLVKDQFQRFVSASKNASTSSAFLMWSTLTHFPYVLNEVGEVRLTTARQFSSEMTDAQTVETLGNYRAQIQFVDGLLGQWIKALIESGYYNDASIIVTSDHGISYGGNNFELDDQVTRVPFFAKLPGLNPGKDPRDVQTIDVAPTLLMVAASRAVAVDGQSLLEPYRRRLKVVLKPNRAGAWVRASGGTWIRYDSVQTIPRL